MTSNGTWDIGSYEDLRRRANAAEARLARIGPHMPAARRALLDAITRATGEAEAKPYRVALQAFGGEEP